MTIESKNQVGVAERRQQMLSPLQESIENGIAEIHKNGASIADYDVIVGDDFSGRIPTFAILNIARELRNPQLTMGILIEPQSPYTEFANDPKRNSNIQSTKERLITNFRGRNANKVLFVTELIETGKTVDVVSTALAELDINHDVFALSCPPFKDTQLAKHISINGAKLFVGKLEYPKKNAENYLIHGDYELFGLPIINPHKGIALDIETAKRNAAELKQTIQKLSQSVVYNIRNGGLL